MFDTETYKSTSKRINTMSEHDKETYLDGVFNAISNMNALAKGGDLTQEDRLKLDMFWQLLEMGASLDYYKRAMEGRA